MGFLVCQIFAALTAIFAKVGVKGLILTFALIRTGAIIICFILHLLLTQGSGQSFCVLLTPKTWIFLTLSGLAGASWVTFTFRALKIGGETLRLPQ